MVATIYGRTRRCLDATLVLDRHDLIYAYGPLEQFRAVLKEGLLETQVDGPPYPHAHMNMMSPNGESSPIFNGPAVPC